MAIDWRLTPRAAASLRKRAFHASKFSVLRQFSFAGGYGGRLAGVCRVRTPRRRCCRLRLRGRRRVSSRRRGGRRRAAGASAADGVLREPGCGHGASGGAGAASAGAGSIGATSLGAFASDTFGAEPAGSMRRRGAWLCRSGFRGAAAAGQEAAAAAPCVAARSSACHLGKRARIRSGRWQRRARTANRMAAAAAAQNFITCITRPSAFFTVIAGYSMPLDVAASRRWGRLAVRYFRPRAGKGTYPQATAPF